MNKTGQELVTEIAVQSALSLDDFMRRSPKNLSLEQRKQLIQVLREERAMFQEKDAAKKEPKDDNETDKDDKQG